MRNESRYKNLQQQVIVIKRNAFRLEILNVCRSEFQDMESKNLSDEGDIIPTKGSSKLTYICRIKLL